MAKSNVRAKVNELLYQLLNFKSRSKNIADNTSVSSGSSAVGYTSGQQDLGFTSSGVSFGTSLGLGGALGAVLGLVEMAHSDYAAKVAYDRQNEMYNNHFSMPAKLREYQEAGLNPMGLAGVGAGATSAPSVSQGETPDFSSAISSILGLVNQSLMVQADVDYRNAQTEGQRIINRWKDEKERWEMEYTKQKARRETLGYDIDSQTLRIATSNADNLEVFAQYYPDLLQADLDNKNAQTALAESQKSLTDEETKRITQLIEQAEQRFPEEMKQIKAKTAEIRANTAYLGAQKNLSEETRKEVIERTSNLVEERKLLIKKTNLVQKEYDCYNAIHSEVTVVPDLNGNKDRVVVKSPDGSVTSFDMTGIEKTFKRDLKGNKIKK